MNSPLKIAGMALSVSLLAGSYQYLKLHGTVSASLRSAPLPSIRDAGGSEHFSPADNLEQLEMRELTSAAQRARAAKRPLDIAIYAFTDRALAALLAREAAQGTDIRIYRDGEQYEQEERNAARFRDRSTTAMFRGQHNIHVRVKAASRGDLMHLKDWSDGQVLREGSANWSPSALKRQDNNIRFSHDLDEVRAFEADFDAMWNRPSNRIMQ
jgi:phosphatidylserine/phosphatidylglycerophosphate/cardiolipin synthase-like enzyme